MQYSPGAAFIIAKDIFHLVACFYIDDLHGNTEIIIIDRVHHMKLIIYVQCLRDGKIEIHRL